MRILIIRHGEPDYENDSLTEKGRLEAESLVKRTVSEDISEIYSSPMGRAKMTAMPTAKALQLEIVEKAWLHEYIQHLPDHSCPWSLHPSEWTAMPCSYRQDWMDFTPWKDSEIPEAYAGTCRGLDTLLEEQGYIRNRENPAVFDFIGDSPNRKTIAFFCHMGLGTSLLSYFLNIPLPQVWHTFYMAPSSVTSVCFETRHGSEKVAFPRLEYLNDTGHLLAADVPVSKWGLWIE